MNLNIKAEKIHSYDAIVIGTGISGGWAAKELCERGLKTLVLERGRDVEHIKDYPTALKHTWELPYNGKVPASELKFYPVQKRAGYFDQSNKHWWVNDLENPYTETKPFDWIRGYHVGGKSLMWSRQCYRLSDLDFEANAKDGFGVDWPIRYRDIEAWYSKVEKFAGINGSKENLPQLPDGEFLPPMDMTCLEKSVAKRIEKKFADRRMIIGRSANLTQNLGGRTQCQYRDRCIRGCPFGAYFSSNSSTLPAAAATGNMTLRPFSIVSEILVNNDSQKAKGVRVIDAESNEVMEFYAKIIFVNASTIASTFILLNSISDRFPNGLGNDSGELGHNLMDHHHLKGASGWTEEFADKYYFGRRPNGIYIPRFRNIGETRSDYVRGFGYQGNSSRESWTRGETAHAIGEELKTQLMNPGPWNMGIDAFGEFLPYHDNHISLNHKVKDKWGLPTLNFDVEMRENELAMRKDMQESAIEMLEAAGLKDVKPINAEYVPGNGIHEMGTARMGHDPRTSVLNGNNQIHAVKNVFVSDGACMTSSANQNPSLTYMALTARAANFAVDELNRRNL